jgi:calcineurin-like phosphoesterase family protein
MTNVWFTSDLHFGHKNIQKFRLEVESSEHNDQRIILDWHSNVNKSQNEVGHLTRKRVFHGIPLN